MMVVDLMGAQDDAQQSEKHLTPTVWYLHQTRRSTDAKSFLCD